ncbi:hypothetical protein [Cupriavidus metallidurans]|nr:hypothetical protein [Cupriavidus metallidurans]
MVLMVGVKVAKVIKGGTVDTVGMGMGMGMGIGAGSVTMACAC